MNETAPIVRKFNSSDSYLTDHAQLICTAMKNDIAKFTAFDSTLTLTYANDFQDLIDNCLNKVSDDVIVDEVAAITESVEQQMVLGRNKYTEVSHFVKKAYANSKPMQNSFGLNDYESVRRNGTKLANFLFDLHAECVKNQATLVSAGYSATKIEEIESIYVALRELVALQNDQSKERTKTTEKRVIDLNDLYEVVVNVDAAGQFVYADSPATRAIFVFDPTASDYDGPGAYDGIIKGGGSAEVARVHYSASRMLTFENTGSTELQFFLNGGGLSSAGTTVITVAAHSTHAPVAMSEMDATGNHIIVRNTNADNSGSYVVTVGEM